MLRYDYASQKVRPEGRWPSHAPPHAALLEAFKSASPGLDHELKIRHLLLQKIYLRAELALAKKRTAVAAEPPRRKIGRNEPCPCGSGKKFKHCCLNATPDAAKSALE